MDGKRKLRIAHRNRLFRAGACQQSRHDADGRELRRNRAQGYAHQDRARTLGNGYQAGACPHDARLSPSSPPTTPSRSPAHTSSDPPAAPKIAMPMSTCLRNARGRRTDTTATATSAAPFANVHSSRMKESCVSYRGNRCTFSDQLLNVSNANARPCANENKPAFGGATPSPFCSRDLNMPVL